MISKTDKDISINVREVYRYLGYGRSVPDDDMAKMIDSCIMDVIEVSEPRYIAERFPISESPDEGGLIVGGALLISKDLERSLKGCEEAYLMGVTIGVGVDRLIARASVSDVTKAAIYQAVGAAYIEDCCDQVNEEINDAVCKEGLKTRPRYSPGYGDLSLKYQEDISRLLNLPKNVGISLSESKIMSPSKSVTAIIGLEKRDVSEAGYGSRKGGGTCAAGQSPEKGWNSCNPGPDRPKRCSSCDRSDCGFREV